MYAALGFGFRHALYAVNPAFVFELAVGAPAAQRKHRLLNAAHLGFGRGQQLGFKPVPLGIALVHPQKNGSEQRRLVPARPRADFNHDVAAVVGVLWQKQDLKPFSKAFPLFNERGLFLLDQLLKLGLGAVHHILQRRDLSAYVIVLDVCAHDLVKRRALLQRVLPLLSVVHGVGQAQKPAKFVVSSLYRFQFFKHAAPLIMIK